MLRLVAPLYQLGGEGGALQHGITWIITKYRHTDTDS